MNREQIIQMAREAGIAKANGDSALFWYPEIERFAAAIIAATKEEDAKIVESFYQQIRQYTRDVPDIEGAIRASAILESKCK